MTSALDHPCRSGTSSPGSRWPRAGCRTSGSWRPRMGWACSRRSASRLRRSPPPKRSRSREAGRPRVRAWKQAGQAYVPGSRPATRTCLSRPCGRRAESAAAVDGPRPHAYSTGHVYPLTCSVRHTQDRGRSFTRRFTLEFGCTKESSCMRMRVHGACGCMWCMIVVHGHGTFRMCMCMAARLEIV